MGTPLFLRKTRTFLGKDITIGGIMIGRLVRYTYTNEIGIVLRRKVTRRAIFRYDVFINGKVLSILPQMLEVIDE